MIGFVILGLLAAVVHLRAGARERAADTAFPPEGQLLDMGGRTVHVLVMGSGPDVVLVHGASGNVRDMTGGFAERLAERYRVIILDRPGLGHTPVRPGLESPFARKAESLAEQADLLAAAARQLGAERPLVVGQSYGGAVSLAWALAHPVAGLVQIGGVSHPWEGELSLRNRVFATRLGAALLVPLATSFAPTAMVHHVIDLIFAPDAPPPGYHQRVGAPLSIRRRSLRANARQISALKAEVAAQAPRYPSLSVPIEIVHGEEDTTVGLQVHAEPLAADVPGAVLTRLPGTGHMPHHTAQDDVIAAVDRVATRAGLHKQP